MKQSLIRLIEEAAKLHKTYNSELDFFLIKNPTTLEFKIFTSKTNEAPVLPDGFEIYKQL